MTDIGERGEDEERGGTLIEKSLVFLTIIIQI